MGVEECRDPQTFKKYLLPHLREERDEASKFVIRETVTTWGGDMGAAVADALEHFPEKKLKNLRKWMNLYEPWCQANVLREVMARARISPSPVKLGKAAVGTQSIWYFVATDPADNAQPQAHVNVLEDSSIAVHPQWTHHHVDVEMAERVRDVIVKAGFGRWLST
jgi:hypothetical protein